MAVACSIMTLSIGVTELQLCQYRYKQRPSQKTDSSRYCEWLLFKYYLAGRVKRWPSEHKVFLFPLCSAVLNLRGNSLLSPVVQCFLTVCPLTHCDRTGSLGSALGSLKSILQSNILQLDSQYRKTC